MRGRLLTRASAGMNFLSDLRLIPEIWRGLVEEARSNIAYREQVRAFAEKHAREGHSPATKAMFARVAARRATKQGGSHLAGVGPS